jgi:hypothetical protein
VGIEAYCTGCVGEEPHREFRNREHSEERASREIGLKLKSEREENEFQLFLCLSQEIPA